MSDLLSTLAQQTLGLAAVVQPRVTSRFGPVPLVLADVPLALPAPSEPSPWGPPPPGLLNGVDAQAPLFSWRQMQDAAMIDDAVTPMWDGEGIDTAEPLDESVTTLAPSPVAPQPQPSAGDVTTQSPVAVPAAGPAVSPAPSLADSGQEQGTFAVVEAVAEPVPHRVPPPEANRAAAVGWTVSVHPVAQNPTLTTGPAAIAPLRALDVLPVSAATVDPPVSPPAAQRTIEGTAHMSLGHAPAPGIAPGHSTPSDPASEPAASLATIAEPAAAPRGAVRLPSTVPGSTAGEEHARPVPATTHRLETMPGAPAVSLQAAAGAADGPASAGLPSAAPAVGQHVDGTSSMVPPVLLPAPAAMPGNAVSVEPAASIPGAIQLKAEASSLAPVGRSHVLVVTPSSTTTSDPTMAAPAAITRPLETAATALAAPGHAPKVTLMTPVADEPVLAASPSVAEADARTPVIPAPAVTTTADSTTFAVQPGPAPAPTPRAAGAADIAPVVSGTMPVDGSRDTTVDDRPASSTAAGQAPTQATTVTPLTPALVTAGTVPSSGAFDPPGSVPSAEPHAGQPVVDATVLPEPHPSPAPLARAGGSPAAALVSTVSPRISTTAVLTPAMPSPAPAAVAGATGPVNPMAPEPNVIPPLAEIIARTPVAPAGAPVATSDSAVAAVQGTREPSVMTPGAPAPVPAAASASPIIAQHAAPVPAAIPGTAEPAAAGLATAGLTHIQHTAEIAAAALVAPLHETITPAAPALAGQPALIPAVVQRTADEAAVMPVLSSPALAAAPGATVPTHEAAFTPAGQQPTEAAYRAQTVHLQETTLTSGGARVIEQSTPAVSAVQHPTGPPVNASVVSPDAPAVTPRGAAPADQPVVVPTATHRMVVTPAAQAGVPSVVPDDHATSDQMAPAATRGARASKRPAMVSAAPLPAAALSPDTATVHQVLSVFAADVYTNAASAFAAIVSTPASPGGSPREDRPIGIAGEDHGSGVDGVSPVQVSPSAAPDPQSLPVHPEPTIHPARDIALPARPTPVSPAHTTEISTAAPFRPQTDRMDAAPKPVATLTPQASDSIRAGNTSPASLWVSAAMTVTPSLAPDSTINARATNLPPLTPAPTTNTGATVTPSLALDSTINARATNLPPLTPDSTTNANAMGTPAPISAANTRASVTPSPAPIATTSARATHPTPRAHTPEPPTIEPTPQSPLPNPQPPTPTPYSLLPTPYSLRITIGRIDVRVTAPPPPASARREPTRPTVSLDDYLSGAGSPP